MGIHNNLILLQRKTPLFNWAQVTQKSKRQNDIITDQLRFMARLRINDCHRLEAVGSMDAAELMEGADINIATILDFRNGVFMCTECR